MVRLKTVIDSGSGTYFRFGPESGIHAYVKFDVSRVSPQRERGNYFRFRLCIRGKGLFFDEEILVETLHLHRPGDTDAHPMLDHQVGQAVAVDEHDALW